LVNRLERLKRIAEKHMQDQIKIIQMLTTLNINEFTEFNQWHKNHPLYKEIPEMIQLLSQKETQIK
jgi:hypothetical protein